MSYSAFWAKPDNPRAGLRDLLWHLASAVQAECPDPAGFEPPIDAGLTSDKRTRARSLLQTAAQVAQAAVDAEHKGHDDDTIARWRSLLG
jgi:hypothetical protein